MAVVRPWPACLVSVEAKAAALFIMIAFILEIVLGCHSNTVVASSYGRGFVFGGASLRPWPNIVYSVRATAQNKGMTSFE